jgi:hypothetical protein
VSFEKDSALKEIGRGAFSSSSLESVSFPQSLKSIGAECFCACRSLSSVSFEPGCQLERIDSQAFVDTMLRSLLLPTDVPDIADDAFDPDCEVTQPEMIPD